MAYELCAFAGKGAGVRPAVALDALIRAHEGEDVAAIVAEVVRMDQIAKKARRNY